MVETPKKQNLSKFLNNGYPFLPKWPLKMGRGFETQAAQPCPNPPGIVHLQLCQVYLGCCKQVFVMAPTTSLVHGDGFIIHALLRNFLFSDWLICKYTKCIENAWGTPHSVPRLSIALMVPERYINQFFWLTLGNIYTFHVKWNFKAISLSFLSQT